jgi:hypothetical protein
MEESPQPPVTGRVVRGIDRLMVLAEELLALWFGEVSQDHQRIGGVFRRLCGHVAQFTPVRGPQLVHRTDQDADASGPIQVIRPDDQLHRHHLDSASIVFRGLFWLAELTKIQGAKWGANGGRRQATQGDVLG